MSPQLLPTRAGDSPPQQQQQQHMQRRQQQQEAAAPAAQEPPTSSSNGGGGGSSVLELLDSFLAVQRERAGAYRRFDAAFRAFLQSSGRAEGIYRQVTAQVAAQFQECSRRVLAVEAALVEQQQQQGEQQQQGLELAALLRTVQENEREKLRLTLALQALKSAHAQQRFSWQHEEAAAAAAAALVPGVSDLLQGHLCGVGCQHEAPADEPTQAEYSAAVRETYQLLQGSITAINEALEEVQQARADLLDQ